MSEVRFGNRQGDLEGTVLSIGDRYIRQSMFRVILAFFMQLQHAYAHESL